MVQVSKAQWLRNQIAQLENSITKHKALLKSSPHDVAMQQAQATRELFWRKYTEELSGLEVEPPEDAPEEEPAPVPTVEEAAEQLKPYEGDGPTIGAFLMDMQLDYSTDQVGPEMGLFVLGADGRTPEATTSIMEWGRFMADIDKRRVALTEHPTLDVYVSTVCLGNGCSFDKRVPRLFQSLIFGGEHHGDEAMYATWEEAKRGHQLMCIIAGILPERSKQHEG